MSDNDRRDDDIQSELRDNQIQPVEPLSLPGEEGDVAPQVQRPADLGDIEDLPFDAPVDAGLLNFDPPMDEDGYSFENLEFAEDSFEQPMDVSGTLDLAADFAEPEPPDLDFAPEMDRADLEVPPQGAAPQPVPEVESLQINWDDARQQRRRWGRCLITR